MTKFLSAIVFAMLAFGCQPSMATDYVTEQEFGDRTESMYNSVNAQISQGIDGLNQQVSDGLAAYSQSFDEQFRLARADVDDQASLSLALASAPGPINTDGTLGISIGLGYLHDRSTALAMKFGQRDWQLGAAINRRAFALSAGCRL